MKINPLGVNFNGKIKLYAPLPIADTVEKQLKTLTKQEPRDEFQRQLKGIIKGVSPRDIVAVELENGQGSYILTDNDAHNVNLAYANEYVKHQTARHTYRGDKYKQACDKIVEHRKKRIEDIVAQAQTVGEIKFDAALKLF